MKSVQFFYIPTNAQTTSHYSVVQEINKINQAELDLGLSGASWHDEYKDSAYIFVGGLHRDLTEGDVITIFSQLSLCSILVFFLVLIIFIGMAK